MLGSASSTTSGAISGSSSGQSRYLDALQSQNTKPASGLGLRRYLDSVVASKTMSASTPTPVVAKVRPEPTFTASSEGRDTASTSSKGQG